MSWWDRGTLTMRQCDRRPSRCAIATAALSRWASATAAPSRWAIATAVLSRCAIATAAPSRCAGATAAVSRCASATAAPSRCAKIEIDNTSDQSQCSHIIVSQTWPILLWIWASSESASRAQYVQKLLLYSILCRVYVVIVCHHTYFCKFSTKFQETERWNNSRNQTFRRMTKNTSVIMFYYIERFR